MDIVRSHRNEGEIKKKREKTNIKRYGHPNPLFKKKEPNYNWKNVIEKEHFGNKRSLRDISKEYGIHKTTLSHYCRNNGITPKRFLFNTEPEIVVENILRKLKIKYSKNDRKEIYPHEIDFYLPDYRVGIEVNGVYWHSRRFKNDKELLYNDNMSERELAEINNLLIVYDAGKKKFQWKY